MSVTEVRTQAELDAALKAGKQWIDIRGDGYFEVQAYDSATVQAYDSATVQAYGSATVRAYGSATVRAYGSATVQASGSATVRAYGSATVQASGSATVRAYGSATVRAYDSATVRAYDSATVQASGSATVRAYDSATVRASKQVAVSDHGPHTTVTGGVLISIRRATTGVEWCDFYDIHIVDGIAVLFKAVGDDWRGNTKTTVVYEPGSTPQAPDWLPSAWCGNGLHFSPRPWMADAYHPDATRYVACPVRVDTMVLLDDKVKAPGVAGPVFECDIDGGRIGPEPAPVAEAAKPKRARAKKAATS